MPWFPAICSEKASAAAPGLAAKQGPVRACNATEVVVNFAKFAGYHPHV